eukprot:CAMPEP_0206010896 /NCGR_PEP_ID=MMETSP1464-20131121/12373_1 /ASSEMBLY_ACC=CAM_ASM_001124 /TAXON_ID=119497 /ORGANISM="Exanthemachrysis gayraliae, Strain RCC1523" /LENGTH=178 /DNA_ID=CAMNT_0053384539 /DNA_START=88 /DNA_END=622 /DNA_ORIENTATION=-
MTTRGRGGERASQLTPLQQASGAAATALHDSAIPNQMLALPFASPTQLSHRPWREPPAHVRVGVIHERVVSGDGFRGRERVRRVECRVALGELVGVQARGEQGREPLEASPVRRGPGRRHGRADLERGRVRSELLVHLLEPRRVGRLVKARAADDAPPEAHVVPRVQVLLQVAREGVR